MSSSVKKAAPKMTVSAQVTAPAKTTKPPAKKVTKAIVQASPDNRLVVQSNALIKAAHSLSLPEKRLIALATTKVDSFKPPLPGMTLSAKITGLEYARTFKLDRATAYQQLAKSADDLYKRSITFQEPASTRNKKAGAVARMRWVGKIRYHEGEGWVGLEFWHEVVPHLTGLRAEFTKYRLDQASALRSVTSWRLLELLQRFASTGRATYTVAELCTAMEATAAQAKDFGKIRTQLIEPAVAELTEKAGWVIAFTPEKTNRKVTSLHFEFQPPR